MNGNVNGNGNLNGSVNGTCKQHTNNSQNFNRREAIALLKQCNYRTEPKLIDSYLSVIFTDKSTKHGHWLYIAQHYTPKTINSVLRQMIRGINRGDISPKVPSAYFTYVVKRRHTRRIFRKKEEVEVPNF